MPDLSGHRLANRYLLTTSLGQGGQGEVWAGVDTLDGARVAVKLLTASSPRAPGLAEAAALRLLRVPGVVRLREAGEDQGRSYLVTDLVEGEPFPSKRPWTEVLPLLFRLLSVLAEVHQLGVLHGDLKPDHAVVRADGQVVLLDFGLASGLRLGAREDVAGTPGYAALELLRGEPPSPRTDLFAVGAIAYKALTGHLPWEPIGRTLAELRVLMDAPPEPLSSRCPDLPPAAERLIHELLAAAPADRPVSAEDAAQRLQDALASSAHTQELPGELLPEEGPVSREALVGLFWGPERVLHLPSDAAAAVRQRAGDDPRAIRRELQRWGLLGLARRDGARLRITRSDLATLPWQEMRRADPRRLIPLPPSLSQGPRDLLAWVALAGPYATLTFLAEFMRLPVTQGQRWLDALRGRELIEVAADGLVVDLTGGAALGAWDLGKRSKAHGRIADVLPPGTAGRLRHLLAADALEGAAREGLLLAEELVSLGRLDEASALLEQGVRWARANGHADLEADVLEALTPVVLAMEAEQPTRRAAHLIALALDTRRAEPLRALMHAAIAALQGDPAPSVALESMGPLPSEDLEIWRAAVLARAAERRSPLHLDEALTALERDWVHRGPERAPHVAGWRGHQRYVSADFEGAARHHLEAARGKRRPHARLSSWLNASASFIEIGKFVDAELYARKALQQAAELRLTVVEARATRLIRMAQHRAGCALRPDPELIEVAAALGDLFQSASMLQCEAAIAWRCGDARAEAIAAESARRFRLIRYREAAVLMDALRVHLGADLDADAVAEAALEVRLPLVRVQALALVAQKATEPARLRRAAQGAVDDLPHAARSRRREVLSIDEALKLVERGGSQS